MSIEDGNSKTIANLGLSSKINNRSVQLNKNIGAAANANATTSKVDITLLTNHPLSELVWCPGKGISVKNTERDHCLTKKFGVNIVAASGRARSSLLLGALIHGNDEVIGLSPSRGVGNSDAVNAVPGNTSSIAIRSQECQSQQYNDSTAFADKEGRIRLKIPEAVTEMSEKLEFSAGNYILAEASKDANPETLKCNDIRLDDGSFHAEKYHKKKRKEEYLRKGKGKTLSDGDINDQMSDDNLSYGSAGSCNSKQLATPLNTKRSLDKQLMITNKRRKQSTERDTDSVSLIKRSSSFMSWITNMVKGCNQDDTPSSLLASVLTAHADQENCIQKPVAHELRGVGFRSLFQSISCSGNHMKGREIHLTYRSTMVDVSAIPLAVYEPIDNVPEDSDQLSKRCDQRTSVKHIRSLSNKDMVHSSNFSTKELEILSKGNTISSTDKDRVDASEYNEEKEDQQISRNRDYLGSLWITRFRPKISQTASDSKSIICNRALHSPEKIPSPRKGLMDEIQGKHLSGDPRNSHTKENNGFVKHGGLVGSELVNVKDEPNMEVMASVFARRLDALKQVAPFNAMCNSSSPLPNKISASMAGIFDCVRRLRLSRSDFLRLMDSQIPLSHLRGFYIRVRLSNWKESLGGRGYYVACIHGTALDEAGHKTSVGVSIGTFTCLVESRYISNHDFLKDELVAWWREITEGTHSHNPSLEELEQQIEERQRLGF